MTVQNFDMTIDGGDASSWKRNRFKDKHQATFAHRYPRRTGRFGRDVLMVRATGIHTGMLYQFSQAAFPMSATVLLRVLISCLIACSSLSPSSVK